MATKSFNRRFHGRCGGKFSFFRNPFVFVILWLVVAAGIGAIVMLLWNWLMPVIFGLPVLLVCGRHWACSSWCVFFSEVSVLAVEEGGPEEGCLECPEEEWIRFVRNGWRWLRNNARSLLIKGRKWDSVPGVETTSLTGVTSGWIKTSRWMKM